MFGRDPWVQALIAAGAEDHPEMKKAPSGGAGGSRKGGGGKGGKRKRPQAECPGEKYGPHVFVPAAT